MSEMFVRVKLDLKCIGELNSKSKMIDSEYFQKIQQTMLEYKYKLGKLLFKM